MRITFRIVWQVFVSHTHARTHLLVTGIENEITEKNEIYMYNSEKNCVRKLTGFHWEGSRVLFALHITQVQDFH
jgi:hypothetical protein